MRANEDGEIIEEEQHQPTCRNCGVGIGAKEGNTSNLFQHLCDHHPELLASISTGTSSSSSESRTMTQRTIKVSLARWTKYHRGSPQAKIMTRAITYYLAKDAMPLYTVEKPGFKHMVSKLDTRYELPLRKFFSSREIPALYLDVRRSVMAELMQVRYYAITTDLWTSSACEPYITLTIHYIDGEWGLKSNCLDTVALFADHTGDNIAESVIDILANWELKPRIF